MISLQFIFTFYLGLVLGAVVCTGTNINDGEELSKIQETLLQEYRREVARRLADVKSGRDFMRIFVPQEEIESTFVAMVNETVQMKNKGRFFGQGTAVHFDLGISNKAMTDWMEHSLSVSCGEPATILLDMYQELNLARGTGAYLFPGCTWVRRCTGSGCCASERQECASVLERRVNVTRPFVKMSETFIDESGQVTHRHQYLNYTLYEDTACECRDRPEAEVLCAERPCTSPKQKFSVANCECKCRRRCPEPFVQDPATCDCGCAPGNRQCLKITRGKIELQQSQCACVDHGCESPKCRRHWSFSKTHCKCMERAPPPNRARVLNEVPSSGPGASPVGVELLSEPASDMVALVTSTNATTSSRPDEDEDVEENSSSSSSLDDDAMTQNQNPYPPYVRIPVDPERRYSGGMQQQKTGSVEHEDDRPTTTNRPVAAGSDVDRWIDEDGRSRTSTASTETKENDRDETTKVPEEEAISTTSGEAQGTRSPMTDEQPDRRHHGHQQRHHGILGFEDDEDEMDFRGGGDGGGGGGGTGGFGSGSIPAED